MPSRYLSLILTLVAMLGLPMRAVGQVSSATVNGEVTDQSKGVLPGVTVTVIDLETGRQYSTVTDSHGTYQIPNLPPATYKVQAELTGFQPSEVPRVELLVGQNATIAFTLRVGAVQETVLVTSQAPLVDVTSSQIAGNVDRRQMEMVPLQGRNWIELSKLIKGMTANEITNTPGVRDDAFQLNLDGQQVSQKNAGSGFGQPRFSREAIAEFQIVTNLFDITQGRSTGVQVQAISKSGTNNLSGVAYGSFRSDKFNAADPVIGAVLPYSNQQAGFAIGGPVIKDRVHYFFSYEREREPATVVAQPAALLNSSATFATKATQNSYLGRVDLQLNPRNSLNVRADRWNWGNPFDQVSSNGYPGQGSDRTQLAKHLVATWSRVMSNNKFAQIHVGYNGFTWANLPMPALASTPEYVFSGITIGPRNNYPQTFWQNTWQVRYDQSWTVNKHSLKIGGEYLRVHDTALWFLVARGRLFFTSQPSPAEMARRFPINQWDNPAAWDLTGLDSIAQRFDINFHSQGWNIDNPRPTYGVWIGDTWRVSDRLTVNYGVRYDDDWGVTAPPGITDSVIQISNGKETGDFGYKAHIFDHNNVAPRGGFTYNVGGTNDFVIRGGSGIYYAVPVSNVTDNQQLYNQVLGASFVNDNRPGFVLNPTRGITGAQLFSGQVAAPPQQKVIIDPAFIMPFAWQNSIGFQKQVSPVMSFESDLVHYIWYNEARTRDPNLFYDPATGYNKNPAQGRPNPNYTQLSFISSTGKRDYMALANGFTRRFKDNWEAGVTYTLMFYLRDDGSIGYTSSPSNNQFDPVNGEWARSADFQRNTFRTWGIYQFPKGLSVSLAYFYGSGNYFASFISGTPYGKPGTNRLNIGNPITVPTAALDRFEGPSVIPTGGVVPRDSLHGTPLHKVDLRIQEQIKLGKVRVQVIGEIFNLFNHDNFGTFVTQVDNAQFGQARQTLGNAYVPRSGQLGFRVSF